MFQQDQKARAARFRAKEANDKLERSLAFFERFGSFPASLTDVSPTSRPAPRQLSSTPPLRVRVTRHDGTFEWMKVKGGTRAAAEALAKTLTGEGRVEILPLGGRRGQLRTR